MYLAQKDNTDWWVENEKSELIIAKHMTNDAYEEYKYRHDKDYTWDGGNCYKRYFTNFYIEFEETV